MWPAEMNEVNMSLAWAMPVKPDDLIAQLQKYDKALPTIQALRLCHRFGQGSDVHITKLPLEVEGIIEDLVFHGTSLKYGAHENPHDTFAHFENRCAPFMHFDEEYNTVFDEVMGRMINEMELCETCVCDWTEDNVAELFSPNCKSFCESDLFVEVNERLFIHEDYWANCQEYREAWEEMIDQNPKGEFVEFDKLLQKHFGLKAHLAITRATDKDKATWPSNPDKIWHDDRPVQTTTCYLTLPNRSSTSGTYGISEMESETMEACVKVGVACFVNLPDLQHREDRVEQFRRVLRELRLKPYIHPSQLTTCLSAADEDSGDEKSTLSSESEDELDETAKRVSKKLDATKIEWPQLTMLVKASTE